MKKIIVIGAGPAGMMAAIKAAENGAAVTLLEKMERIGKKLLITGKGRCNITNIAENAEIIKNIPGNGVFLNSALRAFNNEAVISFFNEIGVATKVERGGRVFPVSDKAADVSAALLEKLLDLSVDVRTKMSVKSVELTNGKISGVTLADGTRLDAEAVVISTGGASYPKTGSTGDGYLFARALGHTVVSPRPALVPLETEEEWVPEAMGLSLRNVQATLLIDGKKSAAEFGEMLFAHFGVTGPIILSLSRMAVQALAEKKLVEIELNLKPALTPEKLSARLVREFSSAPNKAVKNVMRQLLPEKLIAPVLDLAFIDGDQPVNQITKEERLRVVELLQHLLLTITKPRPVEEAIVTAGGVSTREINPKTMESKLVAGLYFAGEVIDVDGYTGGFNLQAAFSTGAAAGCWSAWND